MYMHTNKKITICKFHLKNKCQSGEKCKFRHLSVNELNDIFTKFKDLKQENTSLKRDLKDKCIKLRNVDSEESGIDDEFESIDKSSVKFKSKLKTQTDVNPKIEAISKNDQNNQNQHLQNKQVELEKRLIYL